MASWTSIIMAFMLEIIIGFSLFGVDAYTRLPELSSWIFLCSCLMVIRDLQVIPTKFLQMSYFCQVCFEALVIIALLESICSLMWRGMEEMIFSVTKYAVLACGGTEIHYHQYEYYYLLGSSTLITFCILLLSAEATGHLNIMRLEWLNLEKHISVDAEKLWEFLSAAINLHNVVQQQPQPQPHPNPDDDDEDDDEDEDEDDHVDGYRGRGRGRVVENMKIRSDED